MINKLANVQLVPTWGDDAFAIITQKIGSQDVIQRAEQTIEKRYRLDLRDQFQNNQAVCNALIESKDCLLNEGTFDSIRGLTKVILRAGTEEIFDRILHELLDELNEMHKKEPTAYLVNHQTGKVMMPMSAKDIYTPPDYADENGILHKSKSILHPAISAPLTMYAYEENRKHIAIARSTSLAAVEHLVQGPESILQRAKMLIESQGIIVKPTDGEKKTIEVGRERVDDMLQAPNYSFHRSQMYGSLLAKKILDILKEYNTDTCDILSIRFHKGSKEQVYLTEIVVSVPPSQQV